MKTEKMSWPAKLAKWIVHGSAELANFFLAAMLVIVFINVALRYFFHSPTTWGDEIMIYLMILMTYFGFGFTLREGKFINMTVLLSRMPEKIREYVIAFNSVIALIYIVVIFIAAIMLTFETYEMGNFSLVTGIPMAPWQAGMTVGIAVLLTAAIWYTIDKIRSAVGK